MVASDLTVRLADHFGAYIASDPALLAETTSICTHYAVAPEDLFYKWEAFAYNHKLPKSEPLTIDHARELRKLIAATLHASATTASDEASTPLKPSAALNRAKMTPDLSAMLGIKATPSKTTATTGAFQTPVRATSSAAVNSPGVTPATASAYKPARARPEVADVVMGELDSPSRGGSSARRAPFAVLESLNEHLALSGSGSQLAAAPAGKKGASRVALAMATDPKAWNYRYMFEKKDERSQVLDDRIDEYASLLRTAYGLEDEELGDPSLPSQEPIWVVGRICPALPAPASSAGETLKLKAASRAKTGEEPFGLPRLAETGVVLESSRMMGSGNRTPLVFARGCSVRHTPHDVGTQGAATTLSLFPGQIVLAKGINAGADKFSVTELCFPPPLPLAVHTPDEAMDHSYSAHKLNGTALNIVHAAGPFTSPHDLEFRPWHRLMDALEEGGLATPEGERRGVPDTLVLTGPFVCAEHELVAVLDEMPSELFARHFSRRLSALVTKWPATTVVLIPSTTDLLNVHSAYPQPGFSKDEAMEWGLPKGKVRCLPNPSTFYINELVVGSTTADSLGDIKAEEMVSRIESSASSHLQSESIASRNKETNTRWSRALLSQRSFYPVYPPPTASRLAYDTSHNHLLQFPAVSPDLLLLPSTKISKPFIRVVANSTIVQPGSLATGSLASIHINPYPKPHLQSLNPDSPINASLYDRARIDILSI